MRTASLIPHERCNQACTYCTFRRASDVPGRITRAAVEARLDALAHTGIEAVTISGGEPLMRADLEQIVSRARSEHGLVVRLETNATLCTPARAQSLAAAGVAEAAVNLAIFGEALDALTRDEGGFERTCAGIDALLGAGIETSIVVAVVRSSLPHLETLPGSLRERLGTRLSGIELVVPVESPDRTELLAYDVVSAHVLALVAAARKADLPVRFRAHPQPPPCIFPDPRPVADLYALTRGRSEVPGHVPYEACARCTLTDRCAKLHPAYVRTHGRPQGTPIVADRVRRRLSLLGTVRAQMEREFVTHDVCRTPEGALIEEDLIRVQFRCNQDCRFCFVSTHLPGFDDETVLRAIDTAARQGRVVTLTGGEPTLHPRIEAFVQRAAAEGAYAVRLQTNAIRFSDRAFTQALVDAGLGEAFVSLHAPDAETSDRITGAPGTFEKTVLGVDHLVHVGAKVILNFVLCRSNASTLPAYVEFVAARWPGVAINVSFVAPSTDVVPREPEFIPRYTDVLPFVALALERARALGVPMIGFESMCGLPLCLVPDALTTHAWLGRLDDETGAGEFVRAPACSGCAFEGRCHGVRRGYAELHGTSELVTVLREVSE